LATGTGQGAEYQQAANGDGLNKILAASFHRYKCSECRPAELAGVRGMGPARGWLE
jgi:hypothetical protein